MYCPSCGAQNDDANRFCLKCGSALPAVAASVVSPTDSREGAPVTDQPRKQIIVAAIVILALIMGIVLLGVSQNNARLISSSASVSGPRSSTSGSTPPTAVAPSGPWKPTKPGVYLKSQRLELARQRGTDPSQRSLPQTSDSQPALLVYLPTEDTQYLQFMRVSGGKRDLGYNTLSYDDGVLEIGPLSALSKGAYCVVLGGPLMFPTDVSWWCFQVNP